MSLWEKAKSRYLGGEKELEIRERYGERMEEVTKKLQEAGFGQTPERAGLREKPIQTKGEISVKQVPVKMDTKSVDLDRRDRERQVQLAEDMKKASEKQPTVVVQQPNEPQNAVTDRSPYIDDYGLSFINSGFFES